MGQTARTCDELDDVVAAVQGAGMVLTTPTDSDVIMQIGSATGLPKPLAAVRGLAPGPGRVQSATRGAI